MYQDYVFLLFWWYTTIKQIKPTSYLPAHFTWKEQSNIDEIIDGIVRSFRRPRIGLLFDETFPIRGEGIAAHP